MKKRILRSLALAAVGFFMVTGVSYAQLIQGALTLGASWEPTGGTGIADATGVNFVDDVALFSAGTGDFSGIAFGSVFAMTDFNFAPLSPSPVSPLWYYDDGVTVYQFELSSVNVTQQIATDLDLKGTGTVHITGFDPTPGTWSFSGDTTGTQVLFAWSSTTEAVPEPATMLLFGAGLAGLAGIRRRKNG